MRVKRGECAYCGERRELTRDHVPPKCLFSKPRPPDLVTVPCCEPCNRELSKHDEYFRIAITTGIDATKFPRENANSIRAINSLSDPARQGFARSLIQNYERNPGRLRVDSGRIKTVLHRTARGLLYHHKHIRLPDTNTVLFRVWPITPSMNIAPQGRDWINRLEGNLTTIGQGVFQYSFEPFEPPDPFGTMWLMRFYQKRTFFCLTASAESRPVQTSRDD